MPGSTTRVSLAESWVLIVTGPAEGLVQADAEGPVRLAVQATAPSDSSMAGIKLPNELSPFSFSAATLTAGTNIYARSGHEGPSAVTVVLSA